MAVCRKGENLSTVHAHCPLPNYHLSWSHALEALGEMKWRCQVPYALKEAPKQHNIGVVKLCVVYQAPSLFCQLFSVEQQRGLALDLRDGLGATRRAEPPFEPPCTGSGSYVEHIFSSASFSIRLQNRFKLTRLQLYNASTQELNSPHKYRPELFLVTRL